MSIASHLCCGILMSCRNVSLRASAHLSPYVYLFFFNDTATIEIFSLFLPFSLFFFNDTATTEIYTLSLHDALPISAAEGSGVARVSAKQEPARAAQGEPEGVESAGASRVAGPYHDPAQLHLHP